MFVLINRETDRSQIDPTELCRLLATAMNFKQLDHQDHNGQTVLHLAAFRGAYLSCVYLLQVGIQDTRTCHCTFFDSGSFS